MKTLSLKVETFRLSLLATGLILVFGFSAFAQGGFNPGPSLNTQNLEPSCTVYRGKPEYKIFMDHIMVGTPGMTPHFIQHFPLRGVEAKFIFSYSTIGVRGTRKKEVVVLYEKDRILFCSEFRGEDDDMPSFNIKAGNVDFEGFSYPMSAQGVNIFSGKMRNDPFVKSVTVTFRRYGRALEGALSYLD
jgi:hypothetical protein